MNLENLNLVELNAQEKREVEGGIWWALAWYLVETINNPSDSINSFKSGREFASQYL